MIEDIIVALYLFIMPGMVILYFSYVCYQTFRSKLLVTMYVIIALVFAAVAFSSGLAGMLFTPLCFLAYFPLRLVYIIGVRADGRKVAFGGGKKEVVFLVVMTILSCAVTYGGLTSNFLGV